MENLINAFTNPEFLKNIIYFFISLSLGFLISFIYKKTNKGFSYDDNLRFSLVFITIIITLIMSIIGSNIALSLGLIGSLSIIRFRTAIKSVVDMVFIFWAIAIGLGVGAGHYEISIVGTVFISLVFIFLDKTNLLFKTNNEYVLIINSKASNNLDIENDLKSHSKKFNLKSSHLSENGEIEYVYNIIFSKNVNPNEVVSGIRKYESIKNISLLSPDTNLYI